MYSVHPISQSYYDAYSQLHNQPKPLKNNNLNALCFLKVLSKFPFADNGYLVRPKQNWLLELVTYRNGICIKVES